MKRRDVFSAALAMATTAAWSPRSLAAPASPGTGERIRWPASVPLLDGSLFSFAADHAHIVVFWSTTCPFCRRHNPHVERLHLALAGRRARVLGVTREVDAARVQRHMAAHQLSFPVTLAHRPLAEALSDRRMIPLTVTVDRLGRLRQVIAGEMFEEDVLELAQLAD